MLDGTLISQSLTNVVNGAIIIVLAAAIIVIALLLLLVLLYFIVLGFRWITAKGGGKCEKD